MPTELLLSSLRQFGLNPEEWVLDNQEETSGVARYLVRPRENECAPTLIGHAFQEAWIALSVEEF